MNTEAANIVRKQYPLSVCLPESLSADWQPGVVRKYQVLIDPHSKSALGKGASAEEAWENAATNMKAGNATKLNEESVTGQQRFEFWACEHWNVTLNHVFMKKDPTNPDRYLQHEVQSAWEGWKGLASRARASYTGAREDRDKVIEEHFNEIGSAAIEKFINQIHSSWLNESGKAVQAICGRLYDNAYDSGYAEQQRTERLLVEAQEKEQAASKANVNLTNHVRKLEQYVESLKLLLSNFKQFEEIITGKNYSTVDVRTKWRELDRQVQEATKQDVSAA